MIVDRLEAVVHNAAVMLNLLRRQYYTATHIVGDDTIATATATDTAGVMSSVNNIGCLTIAQILFWYCTSRWISIDYRC